MDKRMLGQRVRELRKRKQLSQEKLAELVGIEPPSICNIENGKNYPTMQNLEKIISVLGVSFADIFEYEHHRPKKDLKNEIIKLLDENPEKIQDIYKIVRALLA